MITIYGIQEKLNDKIIYVGQTTLTVAQRGLPRKNKLLREYVEQVGRKNIKHIILHQTDNQELADAWEQFYIIYYNTRFTGYNVTVGGIGRSLEYRPVNKLFNGKVVDRFFSLAEASKITGINIANIDKCLHGYRKSAGGFEWEYDK